MFLLTPDTRILVINWSDGSTNKFIKGDKNVFDFIRWKKEKNPRLRIKLRYYIAAKDLS